MDFSSSRCSPWRGQHCFLACTINSFEKGGNPPRRCKVASKGPASRRRLLVEGFHKDFEGILPVFPFVPVRGMKRWAAFQSCRTLSRPRLRSRLACHACSLALRSHTLEHDVSIPAFPFAAFGQRRLRHSSSKKFVRLVCGLRGRPSDRLRPSF